MTHFARTRPLLVARVLASALLLVSFRPSQPALGETARIIVHVDQPGPKISPSLYGIFFEEINHAGDGG
jgi:alpha-L-arabinofuranosidase